MVGCQNTGQQSTVVALPSVSLRAWNNLFWQMLFQNWFSRTNNRLLRCLVTGLNQIYLLSYNSSPVTQAKHPAVHPQFMAILFDFSHWIVSPCRSLAIEAALMGGTPWLISFSGMAEVLGWPSRAPIIADCQRAQVLESWTSYCGGITPHYRALPFAEVRSMQPKDFVSLLANDLEVSGS